MEATRPQPIVLEGLSGFLVAHERCGAGFDIAHPSGPGSGRVSITCRGCGAGSDYATATIEIEREIRIERVPEPPGPPADAPRQAIVVEPPPPRIEPPPPRSEPPPARTEPPPERSRTGHASPPPAGVPAGRDRSWPREVLTPVLIAFLIGALAFIAYLLTEGNGDEPPTPAAAAQQSPAPESSPPSPESSPPPPSLPPGTAFVTRNYAVRVPAGWTERRVPGAVVFAAPSGRVSLTLHFDRDPTLTLVDRAGPGATQAERRALRRVRASFRLR